MMKDKTYTEIQRTDKKLFICPFCFETFRALAYHTRQRHGISAKQLREMFNLKANYQLITDDLKERHREIVLNSKDKCITQNLIQKGRKTRYKKGNKGHLKENWSNQALYELGKRQR